MFWRFVFFISFANCTFAQDGINRFLNVATTNELLGRADVRAELELLDDQIKAINVLLKSTTAKISQAATARPVKIGVPPNEEIRGRIIEVQKESLAELEKILLPHQMKRLRQLDLQKRVQATNFNMYAHPELAKVLGYTSEQTEEIKKLTMEFNEHLREIVKKEMKAATERIRSTLTPEQLAKHREVFGEPFDFDKMFMQPARAQAAEKGLPVQGKLNVN